MGQIKLVGAFFLIAIFAAAIISFVSNFGTDNEAAVQLGEDDRLTILKTNVESDLYSFKNTANSSYDAFGSSEIAAGDETTKGGGFIKSFTGAYSSVKNILGTGSSVIFGDEQGNSGFSIVLTSLSAFFLFLIIMYGWKTWKGGNPD